MMQSLTIIGGTYIEKCSYPDRLEMFGSGLRAACALADKNFTIEFISCIGQTGKENAESICSTFNIKSDYFVTNETTEFHYFHPLSIPEIYPDYSPVKTALEGRKRDNVLYFGMLEASIPVCGSWVVYDPQNHESFKSTGSTAQHLAIVLNKNEAILLSELNSDSSIEEIGQMLIRNENAEVVIIKNGSQGAFVVEGNKITHIPVYLTDKVWPIGTGDIFSSVFAWNWILMQKNPVESASIASQYTATYCQTQALPLEVIAADISPRIKRTTPKQIYLAGPFFSIQDRWLIEEARQILFGFGAEVFSPYHDVGEVGIGKMKSEASLIAQSDIDGLMACEVILCMLNGPDTGTCFEIGYAIAMGKEVIVYSEQLSDGAMIMFRGLKCKITDDFSTALYMAAW